VARVFQMDNPAVTASYRSGRRVQNVRSHDHGVSGTDDTGHRLFGSNDLLQSVCAQNAETMGGRNHFQAAVAFVGGVQVHSDHDHLVQHLTRRADMPELATALPGVPPLHVSSLIQGTRVVLMPGDGPVLGGGLVKEQHADELRTGLERWAVPLSLRPRTEADRRGRVAWAFRRRRGGASWELPG
jgi:hypothetical protein